MKPAFGDTYYYAALGNPGDAGHKKALAYAMSSVRPVITTCWVITEIADGLCRVHQRPKFLRLHALLQLDPTVTILPPDTNLFNRGLALYAARPDKDWSLTDCISFVVMSERGLTDALTADKHFEQAGFWAVLA